MVTGDEVEVKVTQSEDSYYKVGIKISQGDLSEVDIDAPQFTIKDTGVKVMIIKLLNFRQS